MTIPIQEAPLPHFNERPSGIKIDTVVIHCMWAQHAPLDKAFDPLTCIAILDNEKVSAHYSIDRAGGVWRHVAENKRAWHAGKSRMPGHDGRENVNDFSLGIELIGKPEEGFSPEQYLALASLAKEILARYSIKNWLGHDDISPGRKVDPGPKFEWDRFLAAIGAKSKTVVE